MKKLLLLLFTFHFSHLTSVAQGFDDLPTPVVEEKVIDNTPDSIAKALMNRPAPGSTRQGTNPVLFLIGNSTMRNGTMGNGSNGQWGWGFFANKYFDGRKISVENQALGGMSTRTFYTDLWPAVREALQPGDWVIVSIGHNDHADFFDQKRARGVIDGVAEDTMMVGFNERKQVNDTVYSYGHYLRSYIRDIREKGANAILMSLTPRDAYGADGKIVRKPQTQWAAQVAAEERVPFVDLNEISGAKLDSYSHWKEQYHFFGDHIHTSAFGAEMNARSAAEGIYNSDDPALKPLQEMMTGVELPAYGKGREEGKPMVFITGDSTVKNKDKDEDGMWGWGSQAGIIFDPAKITWENVAMAGRSTRSYLREGRWERVYNALQPGDFVLIQFGHNDICSITDPKERGVIPGTADTCHVYQMEKNGRYEVVYSFGWYLRKMIDDTREKGATPILLSLTPRNEWPGGRIERRNDSYGEWYREVVEQTGVAFVDVHNISADFLDQKFASDNAATSRQNASGYFNHDHTHTSKAGAQMNAQSVAKGLRDIQSPLADYLLLPADGQVAAPKVTLNKQRHFSEAVPAGNYSGITWLGGDRYAVVNDKSSTAGFHLMTIRTDSLTGDILSVSEDGFQTSGQSNRDEEGVCYFPPSQTLFVSGEADNQIIEYTQAGQLTGRRLNIPEVFRSSRGNGGFEALTYNAKTHRFWTTTEHTLKIDGDKPDLQHQIPNKLRLQSFGDDLQPQAQYWYQTDSPSVNKTKGKSQLGLSALAALDDGRLIVLEREIWQPSKRIGSFVHVKLYVVNPSRQAAGSLLQKTLLTEFRTNINVTHRSFANFEGMCVGPRLADGRQLLVLVADSQNQYKGWLKDWFKTIVIGH